MDFSEVISNHVFSVHRYAYMPTHARNCTALVGNALNSTGPMPAYSPRTPPLAYVRSISRSVGFGGVYGVCGSGFSVVAV